MEKFSYMMIGFFPSNNIELPFSSNIHDHIVSETYKKDTQFLKKIQCI